MKNHNSVEGERRSLRKRPEDDTQESYGWNTGWPEHLTDNELLQAASIPSISPNILRPGVRQPASPSAYHQIQGDDDEQQVESNNNPHAVKFVNSTVEILQNQIRKEEAPKKKRTRTTPEQLRILQKAFTTDPMPNSSARLALAKKLGMNARAVQVWFQNRRAKEKLEVKRAEFGQCRERIGAFQPVIKDTGNTYIRSLQSVVKAPRGEEDCPSNGGNPVVYDLGMYFGDHALAQYSASFDLGAYSYAMDNLAAQSPQLFDDLPEDGDDGSAESPGARGIPLTRFQSMPTAGFSYGGGSNNNSLGLVFDPNLSEEGTTGGNLLITSTNQQQSQMRSNSIDVLGVMSDAAALDSQGKIFSTPASREAFLTAPLGQSIPMPVKQRSLSVPEIHQGMRGNHHHHHLPDALFCTDLMSIKEEDVIVASPKRRSNAGIPSASLEAYAGMPGIVALDDIQAYLDGMSTGL